MIQLREFPAQSSPRSALTASHLPATIQKSERGLYNNSCHFTAVLLEYGIHLSPYSFLLRDPHLFNLFYFFCGAVSKLTATPTTVLGAAFCQQSK